MTNDEKVKLLKDLKTASRLTKQVRTMLFNISSSIEEEDGNSMCATKLKNMVQVIDGGINNNTFTATISSFKEEQKLSGYQLSLQLF